MKLGVYTAILHDKPLREALEVIASLGLTGAEINAGGFLPTPHLPVSELLSGEVTPQQYLSTFDGTGVSIAGLNCNGNPLHPDPEVGPEDADDLRNAIRVAGLLGVDRVVTMSGLPQAHPGGTVAGLARQHLGLGLSRLAGLPVGRGRGAVLDRDRRTGPRERSQGRHRDAPAEPGVQSADPEAARRQDRRHPRRCGDGPVAPVLAGHRPGRCDRVAGAAGVPRRRQGHPHQRQLQDLRRSRRPVHPNSAGPEPDRPRRPARREQVARGLSMGLRRRRPRPRHRVLGALPATPWRPSTPTCGSTSNTKTSTFGPLEGLQVAAETLKSANSALVG